MTEHFNLLGFLRRIPTALLRAYCGRQGILADFPWGGGRRVEAERLAEALHMVATFDEIVAEFREIHEMADAGLTVGLLNEARFHKDAVVIEAIEAQPSHLAKAFWVVLERPMFIAASKVIRHVDKLPAGAWIKRRGMPACPGPVNQSMVERLEEALIEFFTRTEYRGKSCKIDCLRHGGEEIFYAYAEDYPDTHLLWEDGTPTARVLSKGFPLIFRHNDTRRTLDIYVEGANTIVPQLQNIFAEAVLGESLIDDTTEAGHIYQIERTIEPGFEFRHSPDLGIKSVSIVKMRFIVLGDPWRRFMAEADTGWDRDALHNFVAQLTTKLAPDQVVLDQTWLQVKFERRPRDQRTPSRTFPITPPNSIRLKKDELGDRIVQMLIQSGIEIETDEMDDGTVT
jgi:hypothetical protein